MNAVSRRELPDGRIVEVWRMLFNHRITVTDNLQTGECRP